VNLARPNSDSSLVTVGRWSGTYIVPANHSAPQDLQRRADKIIAGRLASNCCLSLQRSLDIADPAVWRIRDLSLSLSLEVSFSDPLDVAQSWGRRLAAEIYSVVESGEENDSILRFPNKATFLAQFIFDLAAGRAWEKWYYEEFESLRVLSVRQAICAVFLRGDSPPADLILKLVDSGRLETVLLTLHDADARLIFDLCFDSGATAPPGDGLEKWTGIVLELWNAAPLRIASRHENRFRDALRLMGRTLSRFPAAQGDIGLKSVIDGLLDLRRVLSAVSSARLLDSIIRNLASGDLQSAIELATGAGSSDPVTALTFFAERMQGDEHWGAQALAVILGEFHQEKFLTSANISEGESFLSSFGGLFLLGPSLDALRLDEFAGAAAEPSEAPEKTAALLRHLAAVKCCGRNQVADSADDPAPRLFSGFEVPSFRQALGSLEARRLNLTGARDVLLLALTDRDESSESCFFAELVSMPPGNPMFLLRDLARDEWLDLLPVPSAGADVAALVQASLERLSKVWKLDRPTLFLDESLFLVVDASPLNQAAEQVAALRRCDDATAEQIASQLGITREQLAFRRSAPERHLPYFCLSRFWPDFELDPALDCTFSLMARAAFRHFARKLFGFEASSPDHLFQNFLSGPSEVRRIDQRLEVRLPASPLSVILRMAGLQDQKYSPKWLKGSEVWLLPPRE
jgi:hypothetical protein